MPVRCRCHRTHSEHNPESPFEAEDCKGWNPVAYPPEKADQYE